MPQPAPLRNQRNSEVLTSFSDFDGKIVLDIGCGKGPLLNWMRKKGAFAVGIDPQHQHLGDYCVSAVAEKLPFTSNLFDIAVFFNSLHHVPLPSQTKALEEAVRIVKNSGEIIVIEPVASGSYYELMKPVDDEKEIRAAAKSAVESQKSWRILDQVNYNTVEKVISLADLIEKTVTVDPARRKVIEEIYPAFAKRFQELGNHSGDGVLLDQPMMAFHLKPE